MWMTIIGGVIGAVGGPVGAAVGAALGAGAEGLLAEGESFGMSGDLTELSAEINFHVDQDGVALEIQTRGVPEGAVLVVGPVDAHGEWMSAMADPFADSDGQYTVAVLVDARGLAHAYLLFGAVRGESVASVRFLAVWESSADAIHRSVADFQIPWTLQPCHVSSLWRPLIGLCMAVARADGQLDRSEIRHIREIITSELEIPVSETNAIKAMLKQEPSAPLEELLDRLAISMPDCDVEDLLSALSDIAHADGIIHPEEVAIIRRVASYFGVSDEEWPALADQFRLRGNTQVEDWAALLEVSASASSAEIKTAYRRKVQQYHPDKYQQLPPEFRHVAVEMTKQLNEAKDGLLARV